jgi:hypothetical protein
MLQGGCSFSNCPPSDRISSMVTVCMCYSGTICGTRDIAIIYSFCSVGIKLLEFDIGSIEIFLQADQVDLILPQIKVGLKKYLSGRI